MVTRLKVPFEVLSDERMALTRALKLPTFVAGRMTLMKRLTIVARNGRIEHVFYPVFPAGYARGRCDRVAEEPCNPCLKCAVRTCKTVRRGCFPFVLGLRSRYTFSIRP